APLLAAVVASILPAMVAGALAAGPQGPGRRRAPASTGDPPGRGGRVAGSARRPRTAVPHGPSMLLAALAVVAAAAAG
ncbi:MAG: hypothetical protein L0I24_21470, partial [Pseudonocardia sp.]|nr:hypothetical protein [Pseudonocardia sp.]